MKINYLLIFLVFSITAFSQNFEKAWNQLEQRLRNKEELSQSEISSFLKNYEKDFQKEPVKQSILENGLGHKFWEQELYGDAVAEFTLAIKLAETGKDSVYSALYKYDLACLYNTLGYYTHAEPYYNQSLPTLAAYYGQSSEEYTLHYKVLTEMYIEMGNYNYAKPMNDALLFYFKTLKGEKDKYYLNCLNNDARISQGYGEYAKAIEIFEHILTVMESSAAIDSTNYATMHNNLGEALRQSGRHDEALKHYNRSIEITSKQSNGKEIELASVYNNMALSYAAVNYYEPAEKYFDESIRIYKKLHLDFSPDYTNPLSNKADLCRILGRYKQSQALLLEVLMVRERALGNKHINYANALSNLGILMLYTNNLNEAEKFLLEAKDIYYEALGKYHPYYANCLNNLSSVYMRMGKYKETEQLKEESLEIMKKMNGENHERYAYYLMSTVPLYLKLNQPAKAMTNVNKALAILKTKFGTENAGYYDALFNKANIQWKTKDYPAALENFLTVMNGQKQQLGKYFESMSEDEQSEYYNTIQAYFNEFNAFAAEYISNSPNTKHSMLIEKLFDYQVYFKALPLNNSIKARKAIYSSNDTSIVRIYNEWMQLKQLLSAGFKNETTENNYLDVAATELKISKLEQILNKKTEYFSQKQNTSINDIRNSLKQDEALICISTYEKEINDSTVGNFYFAMALKKSSVSPVYITLPSSNEFDKNFYDYYSERMGDKKEDVLSYNRFWKPFEALLSGINNLYFIPEGVYHKINPYTLKIPESGSFVFDKIKIRNLAVPSALFSHPLENNSNTAVLFGNPDYDFDLEKNKKIETGPALALNRYGFTELPALPGTQTEVENISSALKSMQWKFNVFTGKEASESELKKVNSPKILHIATHGFFLSDVNDIEDAHILGFESDRVRENPLLRSGIILAGATAAANDSINKREQDGIFTAYEASLLNLSKTDLVVLSACETGLGVDINNQGVFGLQRAFYIAGAKNLIMSLWAVDDEATQMLMSEFYKNLLLNPKSNNLQNCLTKAQLEVRKKYPHPNYWGAFVLLGN